MHMLSEDATGSDAAIVRGVAAGPGTYTGIARVIRGREDFARLQPGDVLVTSCTSAAFNVVLPLLGALVTDDGGLLSHAIAASREYGIPVVVDAGDATALIADGTLIRVLGDTGEVEVLG